MERAQLTALLDRQDDAYQACRAALTGGSPFKIFDGSLPASHFADIYRVREIHTRKKGIPTVGFAQAVEALYALGEQPLQIGNVELAEPPYYFQLFFSAETSAVVACIGVDQQHQSRR
ncbi:hypothetical protein [Micromonospora musae]|uniref:hypothetical protein n=1 Tax=Micromonospora musae TaxID=1894970 RepID=UPI0033EB6832